MNTEHDTQEPAVMVTYGRPSDLDDRFGNGPSRGPDPLPTVHTAELTTFLQHAPMVVATARDLCERASIDTGDGFDSRDVVSVARTLVARIATEADRVARAAHTWPTQENTGEPDDHTPGSAPDGFERVRSTRKAVKRTRKGGAVAEVTRHGRAVVVGSTRRRDPNWHGPVLVGHASMSADRVAAALESAPEATTGHDGLSIYRVTEVIYGRAIPPLVGGDTVARAEFGTWDEVQAVTRRQSRGSNGSTRISWPDRYGFGAGGGWRADERPTVNQYVRPWVEGRTGRGTRWALVTDCPTIDADGRVIIGHGSPRDRTPTEREQRAAATRVTTTVAIPDTQPISDGLTAAAAELKPGERARIMLRDKYGRDEYFGTVTYSNAERWSASTLFGKVRGARTLRNFTKRCRELID